MARIVFNKKTLLSLFLAAIILVATLFSGLIWSTDNEINSLKTQNTNLQDQNNNLTNQKATLQNQNSQLQNQINNQNTTQNQDQASTLASQNVALQNEINDLESQIQNLQTKVANLTTSNLVTALGITEIPRDSPHNYPNPLLYNHLYIEGSVTNNGSGIAYNGGLHVEAYTSDGTEEVNLTVPLAARMTGGEVTDFGPVYGTDNATQIYGNDPSGAFGSLGPGQTTNINLAIFHEGTVSNWTVTPLWTNSP